MGCDIHAYVEIKKNGEWIYVPENLDTNRDYWAFHFLAEVRDAGPFGCAEAAKGFPSDSSEEVSLINNRWGYDAHSHSFFTLEELLSHVNENPAKYNCLIPLKDYASLNVKSTTDLDNYDESVTDINLILTETEAKAIIENGLLDKHSDKYVNSFFNFKIVEDSSLISGFISDLTLVAKQENLSHSNIRLVFWFDN